MNEWRTRTALMLTCVVSAAALVLAGWALYPPKLEQTLRFYDRLLTQQVQTTGCGIR